MSGLKEIIRSVDGKDLNVGGALYPKLKPLLTAYRRRQWKVFVCVELFIVVVVIFSALYLAFSSADTTRVRLLSVVLGIGTGGGIEIMRRTWKEWAQTDLLLVLLSEATDSQVQGVIDTLKKRL